MWRRSSRSPRNQRILDQAATYPRPTHMCGYVTRHISTLWPFVCVPRSQRPTSNILHIVFAGQRSRIVGHPLFGRTLQVSHNRRGKDLTCIYTDERPDLARELPNWMLDERYCAAMSLGSPQLGQRKRVAHPHTHSRNRSSRERLKSLF